MCQVFKLGTFGVEAASALPETCFDLDRDIRGLIRCTGDVCHDTPELVQIFRNGSRVKIFLLKRGDYVITEHVGSKHTGQAACELEPLLFPHMPVKAAER